MYYRLNSRYLVISLSIIFLISIPTTCTINKIIWGFNYDRTAWNGYDVTLDDILSLPSTEIFRKLDTDFGVMKNYNGNIVRVGIGLTYILTSPTTINEIALKKLDIVLNAATNNHLQVILTGLYLQKPATFPQWILKLTDDEYIMAMKTFWATLASRYKDHPAIFSYNLQNEPVNHWYDNNTLVEGCFTLRHNLSLCYIHYHYRNVHKLWNDYVHRTFNSPANLSRRWPDYPRKGETWENIIIPTPFYPDIPRLQDYIVFQVMLMTQWCTTLVNTIRTVDKNTKITVGDGFKNVFPACRDVLDYYSVHYYPPCSQAITNYTLLVAYWKDQFSKLPQDDKPVIIEEFFPSIIGPCSVTGQISTKEMIMALLQAVMPRAIGVVSFYWGSAESLGMNAIEAKFYYDYLDTFKKCKP